MDRRIAGRARGEDRTERALQLRHQRMSYVRIGRELGVHHSTVYTWLNADRQTRLLAQQQNTRSHTRSQSTTRIR